MSRGDNKMRKPPRICMISENEIEGLCGTQSPAYTSSNHLLAGLYEVDSSLFNASNAFFAAFSFAFSSAL